MLFYQCLKLVYKVFNSKINEGKEIFKCGECVWYVSVEFVFFCYSNFIKFIFKYMI